MKKFKYKSLVFIALLLVLGIVGVTLAYFTTKNEVKNEFQALTYNVDIQENSSSTFGKKVVDIVNKEKTPVVVRVSYNEIWSKEDNENGYLTLNNLVNGVNVVDKEWSSVWKNDFVLGSDGWYYYKKILDVNGKINLINSISLNRTLVNSSPDRENYLQFDYELNFGFEAIQATEEAVKSLWGFDISIDGSDISWF